MMSEGILKKYIPLDKSWMMRVGVLDIIHEYSDIEEFLVREKNLSGDLQALYRAATQWDTEEEIDVGESGTLYRFLQFASWKLDLNKRFIKQGTLVAREICNDQAIVTWPLEKLLMLDHGTSQWASAAVLLGNEERTGNPPYKLRLTYEAKDHWKARRAEGKIWEPRFDQTIARQAETFQALIHGEKVEFMPKQAEDYCFARAFGYTTKEEGLSRWPNLQGHESNRIEEMEKELARAEKGEDVQSHDHRVVQAIAMFGALQKRKNTFVHADAVSKSWPQFWRFINQLGSRTTKYTYAKR